MLLVSCLIFIAQIASALIQCLITRYLSDNAATDAISARLREVSPTLYSAEDAVCSKVRSNTQYH